MNQYDSNRILDSLKKINYIPTKTIEEARLLYSQYLPYKRKSHR